MPQDVGADEVGSPLSGIRALPPTPPAANPTAAEIFAILDSLRPDPDEADQ